MIFASEKHAINKFEREKVKITDKLIEDTMRWLTERDYEILIQLLKNRMMTTEQIEMTVFNNLKPSSWRNKTNERLRRLYHAHCVDRFFPPTGKDCGSSQAVYILDYVGAKALARHRGHVGKFKWKKLNYVSQNYRHNLKILDFKSLLYVLNRQLGYTEEGTVGKIIYWNTQTLKKFYYSDNGKIKEGRLIPDAFAVYKYTAYGHAKLFFLECDNDTEPIETLKSKIINYKRYYQSGEWRNEFWAKHLNVFPAILFLLHSQDKVNELVAYSKKINSNIKFLFCTYDDLYTDSFKEYVNSIGKRRLVLQNRKINILNPIWHSKDGVVAL